MLSPVIRFYEVIEMIEIDIWLKQFCKVLHQTFANRVWFVGLQGSYGRGEATESSDIDVVVILDELSASDIRAYHTMLDSLPNRDLICGFFSGKRELLNWEPSDLFQFYYDTTPIIGSLDELLSVIDESAVDRAVKMGACNLYHSCVHNMLHEKSEEILKNLYKSASFTLQALAFRQTEKYIRHQKELLEVLSGKDKTILESSMRLKRGEELPFEELSEALLLWAKNLI